MIWKDSSCSPSCAIRLIRILFEKQRTQVKTCLFLFRWTVWVFWRLKSISLRVGIYRCSLELSCSGTVQMSITVLTPICCIITTKKNFLRKIYFIWGSPEPTASRYERMLIYAIEFCSLIFLVNAFVAMSPSEGVSHDKLTLCSVSDLHSEKVVIAACTKCQIGIW